MPMKKDQDIWSRVETAEEPEQPACMVYHAEHIWAEGHRCEDQRQICESTEWCQYQQRTLSNWKTDDDASYGITRSA